MRTLTRALVTHLLDQLRSRRTMVRDIRPDKPIWLLEELPPGDTIMLAERESPARPPTLPDILRGRIDRRDLTRVEQPWPQLRPVRGEPSAPDAVHDAFQAWYERWQRWATDELDHDRPGRRAHYEQLRDLRRSAAEQQESHELVLGVGLVSAVDARGDAVCRHVLVWDVTIELDQGTEALRVVLPRGVRPRVEDQEFLSSVHGFRPPGGGSPWKVVDGPDGGPLEATTEAWLGRWCGRAWSVPVRFDAHGSGDQLPEPAGAVTVTASPALMLRQRDKTGLEAFYGRIAEALDQPGAAVPLGLAQLVMQLDAEQRMHWPRAKRDERPLFRDDPLLPLPANEQQLRIIGKLREDTGVVVQGPPGTGKTHTIVNLLTALLAEGVRVLVTSEKDEALRVLRDKLPEPVRPLCVPMTRSRGGGSDELDRGIAALTELAATASVESLQRDIAHIQRQRDRAKKRLDAVDHALRLSREAEHTRHPEIAPGYGGTLVELVTAINAGRERYAWIDPLPTDAPAEPPLTGPDMQRLRALLATATPEQARRAGQAMPDPAQLPRPTELQAAFDALNQAQQILGSHPGPDPAGLSLARFTDGLIAALTVEVNAAATVLRRSGLVELIDDWPIDDWQRRTAAAILSRRDPASLAMLFDDVMRLRPLMDAASAVLAAHDVELDAGTPPGRLLGQAKRLRTYVSRGGRIRRFRPAQAQADAAELLESCTVDGAQPHTTRELTALITVLQADQAVTAVLDDWSNWTDSSAQPAGGSLRRRFARVHDLAGGISALRKLGDTRDTIEHLLHRADIPFTIRSIHDWDLLVRVVRSAPTVIAGHQAAQQLDRHVAGLASFSLRPDAAPETGDLAAALRGRDLAGYANAFNALEVAWDERRVHEERSTLADCLAGAHPALAAQLQATVGDEAWADRLDDFESAWNWGRAVIYHRAVREHGPDEHLEHVVEEAEQFLGRLTTELASKQATLRWRERLTPHQQQDLQSYRSFMRRAGKGKGPHSAAHQAAARDAMQSAMHAVPAWVMPISRVAEVLPPDPDSFDVVIIDEASQAEVDALFLLWLAPRVVVIGDEYQCAPGQRKPDAIRATQLSLNRHLAAMDLRLRHAFNAQSNLYELLSTRLPDQIRLTEHFRCMPEIIGWSSQRFYEPNLIPLRQFGADRLDPLQVVPVADADLEGAGATLRNPTEAQQIVEKVSGMVADPRYQGRTIGIIVLHDCRQKALLDQMLSQRLGAADMARFKIRVGSPTDFQGAERDVILLSMVVTDASQAINGPQVQRRYNVAASRARDQMWLFHSIHPARRPSSGMRYELLHYMEQPPEDLNADPALDLVPAQRLTPPFRSPLQQQVFLKLRQRGFATLPNYPIAEHTIDLIVVGDNARLGVECDTPSATTSFEEIERALQRERDLRRAGWVIVRIRHSEYLLDADAALEPLWQRIEDRGIRPRPLPRRNATAPDLVGIDDSDPYPADEVDDDVSLS
ncbi:AAA domain-containing protein [Dactylosporangium sp. NPDC000555]|uniref:AAA domain-containing protein n=1 Tax=Dactylosporangium sp. NPDC000555 TaxID=3154260 RepID=UPI003316AB46